MKHFYTLPTALLTSNPPPDCSWHGMPCPGAPSISVVVVLQWFTHPAQDLWEAIPGVVEHHLEHMGGSAPAAAITAFAPWGATAGMTLRQLFGVIRAQWPVWRH